MRVAHSKITILTLLRKKRDLLKAYLKKTLQLKIESFEDADDDYLSSRENILESIKRIDSSIVKETYYKKEKDFISINEEIFSLLTLIEENSLEIKERFLEEKKQVSKQLNQLKNESKLFHYLNTKK